MNRSIIYQVLHVRLDCFMLEELFEWPGDILLVIIAHLIVEHEALENRVRPRPIDLNEHLADQVRDYKNDDKRAI